MSAANNSTLSEFLRELRLALSLDTFWGIVLSQPVADDAELGVKHTRPAKLSLRPIELNGSRCFQLAERRGTQEFHENLSAEATAMRVEQHLSRSFLQADLFTADGDITVRIQSNGGVSMKRRKPSKSPPTFAHDRRKQYLIPEGRPCRFLTAIGVMTDSGQVKAPKQAKFRQVNRFLEFVADVLPHLPPNGRLRVVDFGCGKSYLTFALHFLLTELKGRDVEIVGLDLKSDVVSLCQRIAAQLLCRGLHFEVGDIAQFQPTGAVDLVVSLHACDTATDAAIAQAVKWRSKVILAVPCCQQELSKLLPDTVLPGLSRHGILKERFAALATDALRAQFLETAGYRAEVIEFIDLEHTPKNLLIRAVRDDSVSTPEAIAKFDQLKQELRISDLSLERLLRELG